MESLGEEGLTAAQIRKICTPRGLTLNISESSDLEQYVSECGGACFQIIIDRNYCQGVLTILASKKRILFRSLFERDDRAAQQDAQRHGGTFGRSCPSR